MLRFAVAIVALFIAAPTFAQIIYEPVTYQYSTGIDVRREASCHTPCLCRLATSNFSTIVPAPPARENSAIRITVPRSLGACSTRTHADAVIVSPGTTGIASMLRR